MKTPSQDLKVIRKKKGLSLEKAAARIGTSASFVANLESGHVASGLFQRLDAAASFYGVSPHRLLRVLWYNATGKPLILTGGTSPLTTKENDS